MLGEATFDNIEEFFADLVLTKCVQPHKAIFAMVTTFPSATGLIYIFVLCSTATVVEAESMKKAHVPLPNHAEIFKFAALLALDLFELEKKNGMAATGNDLIAHWQQTNEKLFA